MPAPTFRRNLLHKFVAESAPLMRLAAVAVISTGSTVTSWLPSSKTAPSLTSRLTCLDGDSVLPSQVGMSTARQPIRGPVHWITSLRRALFSRLSWALPGVGGGHAPEVHAPSWLKVAGQNFAEPPEREPTSARSSMRSIPLTVGVAGRSTHSHALERDKIGVRL